MSRAISTSSVDTDCSPLALYGASGHARVIIDIARACGRTVATLVDDNPDRRELDGIPVVHSAEGLSPIIVSIGLNDIRRRIVRRLAADPATAGIRFATLIHPSAIVSPSAVIGCGTVIMAGAVVEAGAVIGDHCIINTGATVNHECHIADFVHISPGATLCGNVSVGTATWIGAGATVIPGIRIGEHTIIGAGSTVIRDIPSDVTAVGTPAKTLNKYNMLNNSSLQTGG